MSAPAHPVVCQECGMPCDATEFHPLAACLMFKGCRDSDQVRANLRALSTPPAVVPAVPSDAVTDEQIIRAAYRHLSTWNEDHITFARAILALSQTTQPQAATGDERPPNFWQGMDPWMVEFIGRGVGLVKVLYNEPHDAIDRSGTGDWIQTAIEVFKKAHANGATTPPAATPAAPSEAMDERANLRDQQADAVMPQIGSLLDAWEGIDNDMKSILREQAPGLVKWLGSINRAMEDDATLAQPAPVAAPARSIQNRVTPEMRTAFRDAYREGGFWTDRLDYAFDRLIEAADSPTAAPAPASEAVADDARRYRWLRSTLSSAEWERIGHYAYDAMDRVIDAALQTAPPQAGAGKDGAQ